MMCEYSLCLSSELLRDVFSSVFFFYKSVFRYWIFLNKMHMG